MWEFVGYALGGFLSRYFVFRKDKPHPESYGMWVVGAPSVGKSTLHDCMDENMGPAVHKSRVPTTKRGRKVKTLISIPSASDPSNRENYWERRDYPHALEEIPTQFQEIPADVLVWIIDTETWMNPIHHKYLIAIVDQLNSSWYAKRMRPIYKKRVRVKKHLWKRGAWGKKLARPEGIVREVVMVLNKKDLWKGVEDVGKKYKDVLLWFQKQYPEMNTLTNSHLWRFSFIATSFEEGTYVPYKFLTNPVDLPLEKLIDDLLTDIKRRQ